MLWNPSLVRHWARETAEGIGPDAYGDEAECLWATYGALMFLAETGTGSENCDIFVRFLVTHVGWDGELAGDILTELEARFTAALSSARTRFDRAELL